MLVRDIMQKSLLTLSPESTIREAARLMKRENVGCVLITNGQKLSGVLTDRDITCWLAEGDNPDTTKVGSVMRREVITATPSTDVFEASKIMSNYRVHRLPIVENSDLCGIVTTSDIALVLKEEVDNFFHVEEAYHHV